MAGKALQIAAFKNNRIVIDTNEFNRVLNIVGDRPMSIVSVNGPLRAGKSYILGHFLRYLGDVNRDGDDWFTRQLQQEFHWKNSANRQTTGILVWSEPFITRKNGQEVAILLLDTQGCFDDQTTTNENSLIFALSCLLSSVLVYNFKNLVSEDVLQFLQLFIGYAKMSSDQEPSETFSKLVFLVRDWGSPQDFPFGYYDDRTSAGSSNFKKEKLDLKPEMAQEVQVVHREILTSFASVGCCLMPYPGNGLALYDKVDQLDPEFKTVIKDFVPRILHGDNVTTKKLGGFEVTGNEFKRIVEKWAEIFQTQEIPPVQNVVESTAEVQNRIAASIAFKFYEGEMQVVKTGEGRSEADLESMHSRTRTEAISMFKRIKRIHHEQMQRRFLQSLEEDIERAYASYCQINQTLLQFKQFQAKSEEEREQMKSEMEEKIKEIEKEARNAQKSRGGLFSKIGGFLDDCLDVASKVLAIKNVLMPPTFPKLPI